MSSDEYFPKPTWEAEWVKPPIQVGHGRTICDEGHLIAQCRCIKNHETVNIIPHKKDENPK